MKLYRESYKVMSVSCFENIGILKHVCMTDSPGDLPRMHTAWPSSDSVSSSEAGIENLLFQKVFSCYWLKILLQEPHITVTSFSIACGQALCSTNTLTVGITPGSLENSSLQTTEWLELQAWWKLPGLTSFKPDLLTCLKQKNILSLFGK